MSFLYLLNLNNKTTLLLRLIEHFLGVDLIIKVSLCIYTRFSSCLVFKTDIFMVLCTVYCYRSSRDDYATVTGRVSQLQRDCYPQWRRLVWSIDNTMLACSYSSGTVEVCDIVGTKLFTIPGKVSL